MIFRTLHYNESNQQTSVSAIIIIQIICMARPMCYLCSIASLTKLKYVCKLLYAYQIYMCSCENVVCTTQIIRSLNIIITGVLFYSGVYIQCSRSILCILVLLKHQSVNYDVHIYFIISQTNSFDYNVLMYYISSLF